MYIPATILSVIALLFYFITHALLSYMYVTRCHMCVSVVTSSMFHTLVMNLRVLVGGYSSVYSVVSSQCHWHGL